MPVEFKPTTDKGVLPRLPPEVKTNRLKRLSEVWKRRVGQRVESSEPDTKKQMIDCSFHPLYAAITYSFNDHVPLILYPDALWLQIVQQLAIHIHQNAEQLRGQLVNFEGKKVLTVRRDDFVKGKYENPWEEVFPVFAEQIRSHIGPDNFNSIVTEFSTTTPVTKAAQEIALMDCVQSYFDYRFMTMCGIPKIRLEGEKRDWEVLVNKTQALARFDLEWWTKELVPVLQEFVNVYDGKVNKDFWKDFVNVDDGSGGPFFTGHMTKLSAYTPCESRQQVGVHRGATWRRKSPVSNVVWTTEDFSTGLSMVPFKWEYLGKEYPMDFASGFLGVEIVDNAYRPSISWAVMDRKAEEEDERFSNKHLETEYDGKE